MAEDKATELGGCSHREHEKPKVGDGTQHEIRGDSDGVGDKHEITRDSDGVGDAQHQIRKNSDGVGDPQLGNRRDSDGVGDAQHESRRDSDGVGDCLDRVLEESDGTSASSSECDENRKRLGSISDSNADQRFRKRRRPRRFKGGRHRWYRQKRYGPYPSPNEANRQNFNMMASSTKGTCIETPSATSIECRRAPRNTTQYLIDDHVRNKISPDLSNRATPDWEHSSWDKLMEGAEVAVHFHKKPNKLDQEFVEVYNKLRQDQLSQMSKEDLVRVTSKLMEEKEGGTGSILDETSTAADSNTRKMVSDSPDFIPLTRSASD